MNLTPSSRDLIVGASGLMIGAGIVYAMNNKMKLAPVKKEKKRTKSVNYKALALDNFKAQHHKMK